MRGGILRIGLLVAAVGLGILLLSEAFGTASPIVVASPDVDNGNGNGDGDGDPTPTPDGTDATTPPPPDKPTCRPRGVTVAVYNATQTDGLAGVAQEALEKKGYVFPHLPDNAPSTSGITTVYFRERADRAEARCVARALVRGARVEELPNDTGYIPLDVQIAVLVGADYVAVAE